MKDVTVQTHKIHFVEHTKYPYVSSNLGRNLKKTVIFLLNLNAAFWKLGVFVNDRLPVFHRHTSSLSQASLENSWPWNLCNPARSRWADPIAKLSKAHRDSISPLMFSVLVSRGVFFSRVLHRKWKLAKGRMVDYMDKSNKDDGRWTWIDETTCFNHSLQ